jgi:hypothetical protein
MYNFLNPKIRTLSSSLLLLLMNKLTNSISQLQVNTKQKTKAKKKERENSRTLSIDNETRKKNYLNEKQ